MKHALALSVAATVLFVSFAPAGERLSFAVKAETRLSKGFDAKAAFHSTSIKMRVDGNGVDSPMSSVKVHLEQTTHVELHDLYGALKEGRPAKLERSYDKLAGKSVQRIELPEGAGEHGANDTSKTLESDLEGQTVVFTLGEDGEYQASFKGDKGEQALLERLEEDMDLRALLPGAAVEADKSWDIEAPALHSVLNLPGGNMKLKVEGEEDSDGRLGEELQKHVKGKAKGTYKGQREVEGKKYALIELEGEFASQGQRDDSQRKPPAGTTDVSVEYTVEGELLWDAEAGHFHSCKLTSKLTMTMKNTRSVEHQGESHEVERTTEFEGETEFEASIAD